MYFGDFQADWGARLSPGEQQRLSFGYFKTPVRVAIAVSGTPLENIAQRCYKVKNFFTKVNLLVHLLNEKDEYRKVLIFVSDKKKADRLFELLSEQYSTETGIIHSNKTQNFRLNSIRQFERVPSEF